MEQLFYIQDSRQYVGNDMLWWCEDGCGYTTNLKNAGLFNRERAIGINQNRETDIPWPKEYIDARTRPTVDIQYCKKGEALKGLGIVLNKPKKPKRVPHKCGICGAFVSEEDYYGLGICVGNPCKNCKDKY